MRGLSLCIIFGSAGRWPDSLLFLIIRYYYAIATNQRLVWLDLNHSSNGFFKEKENIQANKTRLNR